MFAFHSVLFRKSEVSLVEDRRFRLLFGSWSVWAWPGGRSRGAGSVLFSPWFCQDGGTEATTWCDFVTGTVVMQVIGIVLLWLFAYLTLQACLVRPAN